jgi:biopolymer transport protein ExbD
MLDRVHTSQRFRGAACAGSAVVLIWGSLGCASAGPCPRALAAVPAVSSIKSEGQLAALSLDLPRASQWSPVRPVIAVELAAGGERRLDGEQIEGDAVLLARLRLAHAKNPSAPAVIKADVQARHQSVIEVMDLLRQAGIGRLAFAVSPVGKGASAPPAVAASSADRSSDGATADAARPEIHARPISAWNCSFPPAPETQAISATVELVVSVDERGKARWVRVLQDPGYGFGQAATICALSVAYEPGRDLHGQPVPSMSPSIRIRFEPSEKSGPSR